MCAFTHWNCRTANVQSNITFSFIAHLCCQCFAPSHVFPMFFVHISVASKPIPAAGCKFGSFQIPGCFNRSNIAPGTETDNDNSLNIKSQHQILLPRNLLLSKDETNFEAWKIFTVFGNDDNESMMVMVTAKLLVLLFDYLGRIPTTSIIIIIVGRMFD